MFTSRSNFNPPSRVDFSFDFVVASPFTIWCTCTFSTPDVASGSLVDMIIIYEVMFIVCCYGPLLKSLASIECIHRGKVNIS
jgi:hypothetical protein